MDMFSSRSQGRVQGHSRRTGQHTVPSPALCARSGARTHTPSRARQARGREENGPGVEQSPSDPVFSVGRACSVNKIWAEVPPCPKKIVVAPADSKTPTTEARHCVQPTLNGILKKVHQNRGKEVSLVEQ